MVHYETVAEQTNIHSCIEPEVLNSEQINVILNLLTSTIDISTLTSLYFTNVNKHLPLVGIDFSSCVTGYSIGITADHNNVSLPLSGFKTTSGDQAGYINYYFDEVLSRYQRRVLATLHQLFTRPMLHAIEFDRLRILATKDSLTHLGNRNGFNEAVQRLINRYNRNEFKFGLLIIDLDNFKQVNDKYGHQRGDGVLQQIANILSETIRGHEEAFRFGGDEFCCLLDLSSAPTLSAVAARVLNAINQNPLLRQYGITASIGGTLYRKGESTDALFERADSALYSAKGNGKDTYQAA